MSVHSDDRHDNLFDSGEEKDDPNDMAFQPISPAPRTESSQSQSTNKTRKQYKQKRAKVTAEWSHEDICKLIKAVEERRTVWDFSSPEYKLPKISAWQEIADLMGNATPDECKAKWSNLRVTFKTNLAKYRSHKSGQGADESFTIVWKYFKSMLFLESNDVRQSTESVSSMSLVNIPRIILNYRLIDFLCDSQASAITDQSALEYFSALDPRPATSGQRRKSCYSQRATPTTPSLSPSSSQFLQSRSNTNSFKQLAAKALTT